MENDTPRDSPEKENGDKDEVQECEEGSLPSMTTDEINYLILAYLRESGFHHSSYALINEAELLSAVPTPEPTSDPSDHGTDTPSKLDGIFPMRAPPGQLIRVLQKGLLYLEAEAHYRQDEPEIKPRLVNYVIPGSSSLHLPKSLSRYPSSAREYLQSLDRSEGPTKQSVSTSTVTDCGVQTEPSQLQVSQSISPNVPKAATSLNLEASSQYGELGEQNKGDQSSTTETPPPPAEQRKRSVADTHSGSSKITRGGPMLPRASGATTSSSSVAGVKRKYQVAGPTAGEEVFVERKDKRKKLLSGRQDESADGLVVREKDSDNTAKFSAAVGSKKDSLATSGASTLLNSNSKAKERESSRVLPTAKNAPTRSTMTGDIESAGLGQGRPKSHSPVVGRGAGASLHGTAGSLGVAQKPHSVPAPARGGPSTGTAQKLASSSTKTPLMDVRRKEERSGEDKNLKASHKDKESDRPKEKDVQPRPTNPTIKRKLASESFSAVVERDQTIILKGHTGPVDTCAWNPVEHGLLAAANNDHFCNIWQIPQSLPTQHKPITVDSIQTMKHIGAQKTPVTVLAWNRDGSLLATGAEDGVVRVWTPSGDMLVVLAMQRGRINAIQWNSKGDSLLAASADYTICLWEVATSKVKLQWSSHTDGVLDVDFLGDDFFASASIDKTIQIFATNRQGPLQRLKGHKEDVNLVKADPSLRLLASGSDDHTVRIWSLRQVPGLATSRGIAQTSENNLNSRVLEGHDGDVRDISWKPGTDDLVLASAATDGTARIWNAETGACLRVFSCAMQYICTIGFDPYDGKYVALASDDVTLGIFRVSDGKLILKFTSSGPIHGIAWHLDCARHQIAVCGDRGDFYIVPINFEAGEKPTMNTNSAITLSS